MIYDRGLELKDRECCSAKLTLLIGITLEDPYGSACRQRRNDPKRWPAMAGHIYMYTSHRNSERVDYRETEGIQVS